MPPGLRLNNSTFCPHSVINMFVMFPKNEQRMFPLCHFKITVFVTETEGVFLTVRTESFKFERCLTVHVHLEIK